MEPTVCPHCGTPLPAEAGGDGPACGRAAAGAAAGLGDNPYAPPREEAAATGGAGGMTVAEKIYSAFVLLWSGFVLVSLASFHFLIIPEAEDPAPLYFVVSLLWIICLSLAVTTAWNLYHRSLLVVPTVLQCAIQALMVYFIPFAIWGGVLLYRRLQREKSRAGPERPEFNIHRPPTNP